MVATVAMGPLRTPPVDASRWQLRSIADADVAGQRVLVRADLNVPIADGRVTDTSRIERFLPTVRELLARGASVVVMSHLGRPHGTRELKWSLAPVATVLAHQLATPVRFIDAALGPASIHRMDGMESGECALLENLRFHAGEEADSTEFARQLATHGEIYVNDAFACSHRAHASLHAIVNYLPSYAGGALLLELSMLSGILESPVRPTMAVVGGQRFPAKSLCSRV